MKLEGIQPVGYGALLGIIITSLVAVIAQFIKRDTTLRSHLIDDRGKITQDTAQQLTQALTRLDKADEHINLLQNDKSVLVNALGTIKAELALLAGLFDQQQSNISTDVIEIMPLRRTNTLIEETITRIRFVLKESEGVYYRNSISPTQTPTEKTLEANKK